MKPYSHLKYFLLGLLVFSLSFLIFLFYQYRTPPSQRFTVQSPSRQFPGPRVQIRGFKSTGTHEGKNVITIQADKFTIEKKKLGPLRFGLINIVRLANADIDIYGNAIQNGRKNPGHSTSSNISFEHIFQKDALPSFSVKRFSSIEMEPVFIKLHDQNGLITRVTASNATISLRNQNAVFSKNVLIISGNNTIESDRVIFDPSAATFIIDRYFVLNTPEKKITGEQLRTDIYLNILQFQSK